MLTDRRNWSEELEIIDRTMKAISGVTDPNELVRIYWEGIGELVAVDDYLALSRRGVDPPHFIITRSSRFTEDVNPWTERDRLPKMSGGVLGEIAFANRPVIIEDLPARLSAGDPARSYLEGFQSLVALPQYDGGEALNVSIMLLPPTIEIDYAMIPMMHWQGGLFGRGTQNLVLRNQVSSALKALDRELQIVGAIQRSLLPGVLPEIPGFELAAYYHTSARAGGDYYDFFPLANGCWGLLIGDVSGHGTPAAVLMAITHAIAHSQPGTHTPPAALLEYLNNQLARAYTVDGSFVTAFYAVLDPAKRKLSYSRAGHNPPRLVHDRKVISLDTVGGLPLGIHEGQTYEQAECALEHGDLLLLYTDGITEAEAPNENGRHGELFGVKRLDEVLLDCCGTPAKDCIDRIQSALADFCQETPSGDDQTLLAIRCR